MMPSFKPLKQNRKKRKLFNWIGVLGLTFATFFTAYLASTQLRLIEIEPGGEKILLQMKEDISLDSNSFIWVRPPWSQNWQELRSLSAPRFSSQNAFILAHLPLANQAFQLKGSTDSLNSTSDSTINLPQGAAAYRVFKALKDSLQTNWTQRELVYPGVDFNDAAESPMASMSTSNCALNSDGDTLCLIAKRPLWVKILTLP